MVTTAELVHNHYRSPRAIPAAELSGAIRRQLHSGPAAISTALLGATLPLELKLLERGLPRRLTAAGRGSWPSERPSTGCASYTEVYGQVLDKRKEEVHSLVLVDKVMVPQTTTKRYLEVEYRPQR